MKLNVYLPMKKRKVKSVFRSNHIYFYPFSLSFLFSIFLEFQTSMGAKIIQRNYTCDLWNIYFFSFLSFYLSVFSPDRWLRSRGLSCTQSEADKKYFSSPPSSFCETISSWMASLSTVCFHLFFFQWHKCNHVYHYQRYFNTTIVLMFIGALT